MKFQASTTYDLATSSLSAICEVHKKLTDYESIVDEPGVHLRRAASTPTLVSEGSIADLAPALRKLCKCSSKRQSKLRAAQRSTTLNSKQAPRHSAQQNTEQCFGKTSDLSPKRSLTNLKQFGRLSSNVAPRSYPSILKQSAPLTPVPKINTSCCSLKRVASDVSASCPCATNSVVGREGKCECDVQQIYFNDVSKSDSSGVGGRCLAEADGAPEVASSEKTTVKREELEHSCNRIIKDSAATCSLGDSGPGAGACDAACAHYYHNKLLSTLQILQNKEETIRVQAESLSVAEGRIAALGARADDLRRELDKKNKEVNCLQSILDSSRTDNTHVSIMADTQGKENPSDIVHTLQNNLTVIEDLYRECFYETAKQESLIDLLRQSYLDVRLSEKESSEKLGRLQSVVSSQQWSLERCQDIAMEVDSLKTEITNFLNSSTTNNDSGMWDCRSEAASAPPAVHEDLRDITDLLLRLRELLTSDCICDLQEENSRLKLINETLENKMNELEAALRNKDHLDTALKEEIERKEKELHGIRKQLMTLEEGSIGQNTTCDALTCQLKEKEVLLEEKAAELSEVQRRCAVQEATIQELKEDLKKAEYIAKENGSIRGEVCALSAQVGRWRAQLSAAERRVRILEAELDAARAQAAHVDSCYREKARGAAELHAQLEEAHARGAALCGEARRAVAAVRRWAQRLSEAKREQQETINEKDVLISELQERLREAQTGRKRAASASEKMTGCSKCACRKARTVTMDTRSCCPDVGARREQFRVSGSETPSCSGAPVPPRRLLRKKNWTAKRCECNPREAEVQSTERHHTVSPTCPHVAVCRLPRDLSPTEQLFLRVEHLTDALADGQRRWTRGHDQR